MRACLFYYLVVAAEDRSEKLPVPWITSKLPRIPLRAVVPASNQKKIWCNLAGRQRLTQRTQNGRYGDGAYEIPCSYQYHDSVLATRNAPRRQRTSGSAGTTQKSEKQEEKAKPEKKEQPDRPPKQEESNRPVKQEPKQAKQEQKDEPANHEAKPAKQEQNAEHTKQQDQQSTQHSQGNNEKRDGGSHGRILDAHYRASFGSGHNFRVNQGDYEHRRFSYGGYSFGFVDVAGQLVLHGQRLRRLREWWLLPLEPPNPSRHAYFRQHSLILRFSKTC